MFFKFFRVLCAFSLRLGVFALRNAAVTEVEPYRRTIHGDFLQRRIHRLFGKSIQAKDIADHTFQNLIPDVCIPACPSAVPASDACAVFPGHALAAEALTALPALDKPCKFVKSAPVRIGCLVLMKLTPGGSAFFGPPVLFGCGFPFLFQNRAVIKMKFQRIISNYIKLFNLR